MVKLENICWLRPKKLCKSTNADVAELVDARDLKCLAALERSRLFWKMRSHYRQQRAVTRWDLENTICKFWWPGISSDWLKTWSASA